MKRTLPRDGHLLRNLPGAVSGPPDPNGGSWAQKRKTSVSRITPPGFGIWPIQGHREEGLRRARLMSIKQSPGGHFRVKTGVFLGVWRPQVDSPPGRNWCEKLLGNRV